MAVLKESVLSLYVDFEREYFICSCIFSVISGEEEGRVRERRKSEKVIERGKERMRSEKFKRRESEKNGKKKQGEKKVRDLYHKED